MGSRKILVYGSLDIDLVIAVDHIVQPGETERFKKTKSSTTGFPQYGILLRRTSRRHDA